MPFETRLAKICEALDMSFYPEKHGLISSDIFCSPSISFRNTFFLQHYYSRKKEKQQLILLKIEMLNASWRISLESDEDFYPLEITLQHIPLHLHAPLLKYTQKFKK